MDKFTEKTSFEQWYLPISSTKLEELVETNQLNHYTKKLHVDSFLKLLVFAQLNETESLRALSDTFFCDDLQLATDIESISFSQLGRRLNQIPTDQSMAKGSAMEIRPYLDSKNQRGGNPVRVSDL